MTTDPIMLLPWLLACVLILCVMAIEYRKAKRNRKINEDVKENKTW